MKDQIKNTWQHSEETSASGTFTRAKSKYAGAQNSPVMTSLVREPGRYYLIASKSCPWSHRTTIYRNLKGLKDILPLHYAGGPRIEGYALNGGDNWTVPGSNKAIRHMHELYSLSDKTYTGRATIPVLWDSHLQKIISNESSNIMRALDATSPINGQTPHITFTPNALIPDIDQANKMIYSGLNNAVYQAGFARSQSAYDTAVKSVFTTLDFLEERLLKSRFYFGATLTETDWRIFPTLCRFDAIYYILFKCSKRRLVDYPALWAYARDLYQITGISETIDFKEMREASYLNDSSSNPPIVAIAPHIDWNSPHTRTALGTAHVALKSGGHMEVAGL